MTRDEIKSTVLDALTRVAPEIDPASIQSGVSFRDQLDLDSMDFLNFVLALHERLGVDIPEADYPRLYRLEEAVDYLASKGTALVKSKSAGGGDFPAPPGKLRGSTDVGGLLGVVTARFRESLFRIRVH